jgi:hypothetical protein
MHSFLELVFGFADHKFLPECSLVSNEDKLDTTQLSRLMNFYSLLFQIVLKIFQSIVPSRSSLYTVLFQHFVKLVCHQCVLPVQVEHCCQRNSGICYR